MAEIDEWETYRNLSREWTDLKSRIGNLCCHIDGDMVHLKRILEKTERDPTIYVRKLVCCKADGVEDYLNYEQIEEIFKTRSISTIFSKYTLLEIMDKIDEYERGPEKDPPSKFNYGDLVRCVNSPEIVFRVCEKGVYPSTNEPFCAGYIEVDDDIVPFIKKIWVLNSQLTKEKDND